jgi:hypothetical protein
LWVPVVGRHGKWMKHFGSATIVGEKKKESERHRARNLAYGSPLLIRPSSLASAAGEHRQAKIEVSCVGR